MRRCALMLAVLAASGCGQSSRTWADQVPPAPAAAGPAVTVRVPAPQRRFEQGGWTETGSAEWRVYHAGSAVPRAIGTTGPAEPVPEAVPAAPSSPAASGQASAPDAPAAAKPVQLAVPDAVHLQPPPVPAPRAAPDDAASATVPAAGAAGSPAPRVAPAAVATPGAPAASARWPGQPAAVAFIVRGAGAHAWPAQQRERLGRPPRIWLAGIVSKDPVVDGPAFGAAILAGLVEAGHAQSAANAREADALLRGTVTGDADALFADLALSDPAGAPIWVFQGPLSRVAPARDPILQGTTP